MSNKMALDALTEDQWLDLAERHANKDWDCAADADGYLNAVKALCADFAAIAALEAQPPPAPHLCIAPACGPKCSDCNSAISDATMRRYAIRYAYLREHDPRFGMPAAWLAFQTLDEAIDAALPTPPKD